MAEIAKSGSPSIATLEPSPGSNKLPTLYAGEAIAAGDACYIKSDGKVWRSTGAAANAAAKVDGFAAMDCPVGEAVTIFFNVTMRYGAALTPGARYYLSGTVAGGLADAASVGGTAPVAFVVDATRIYVYQSRY
jgi:hypothetical protein